MERAALAGVLYFAVVFSAGFLLGTGRVLWLEPLLGKLTATLIELPVILSLSWIASLRLAARLSVSSDIAPRFLMGGLAFALLMAAEAGLSVLLFGRTVSEFVAMQTSGPELPGFLGQALFAFFPVLQLGYQTDK